MDRGELSLTFVEPLIEAGYPSAHILKMMTTNGAELLGVDEERGTIAAGQAADIIATIESPLEDIKALQRVIFVMKDGTVYKETGGSGTP
jgi:imidazolonepropionase-like amidohydrolase